jgi:hypothetical protein
LPAIARQIPRLLFGIFREHRQLQRIIRKEGIDAVISDNRFGLWSKHTWSVYITHQLMIKAPNGLKWAEPLLHRAHGWFISRYRECWIPDFPGPLNLSGNLSHQYALPVNGSFIGPLSRFEKTTADTKSVADGPRWLFLISGPEPQRTLFENIIRRELEHGFDGEAVILLGLPGNDPATESIPGVKIFPHLPDPELRELIRSAGTIICRPGYSTLMDLATLGRTALLVPTPGQTEQEYLARHAAENGSFQVIPQDKLKLELITDLPNTGISALPDSHGHLLEEKIDRLISQLSPDSPDF